MYVYMIIIINISIIIVIVRTLAGHRPNTYHTNQIPEARFEQEQPTTANWLM